MTSLIMQSKADMGVLRTLPVTPPHGNFFSNFGAAESLSKSNFKFNKKSQFRVLAKTEKGGKEEEEEPKKWKQSLLEALDFSQTRSEEDALLLEDARQATKSGEKMSKEQYGALRRKIGGTYKDFFKSYVEVDGQYVEDGWVDKRCKVCKKDTGGEPRQVDKLGRYVHVACLGKSKSGNFFTRLFSS